MRRKIKNLKFNLITGISTRFRAYCRMFANESGQGMTEYIILVILVALVLVPYFRLMPEAVRGYVRPFYYCISKPIP